MLSMVAMLFVALLLPTTLDASTPSRVQAVIVPASTFCAELEGPPLIGIADDGEEFAPLEEEQGCSDSDAFGPFDIEALVDAT